MHRHFEHYTQTLIGAARRLRRDMTQSERRLWSRVRGNQLGVAFRRQVPFGRYVLDFYSNSLRLNVELDGGQHYTPEGMEKDRVRDEALRGEGIEVLRFSDRDVLTNLSGVLQVLNEKIEKLRQAEIHR